MTPKLAKKRYISSMMGSALGYLGAVFGVSFLHDKLADGSAAALALSVIPGIFIAGMVWSLWRYLDDIDEVARHDHVRAMLSGIAVVLVASGAWGLVELFNESLPRLPIFYIFPGFFLVYGLISCIKYKRWA